MPRKHKKLSLSDLLFEPMVKEPTMNWTTRSLPPIELTELRIAVDSLKPFQRHVIRHRYGLNGQEQTLDAIGREWGCTRERVRQVQKEGLRHLKKRFEQP